MGGDDLVTDWVNVGALVATVIALGLSLHFWRRQFRPLVTAMVRTHHGDNTGLYFNLVVLNSGSIPARDVWFEVADPAALAAASEVAPPMSEGRIGYPALLPKT